MLGLGTTVQASPVQWIVRVWVPSWPTAQILSGARATMPSKMVWPEDPLGLGTRLHVLPSQCSTRVWAGPTRPPLYPAAQRLSLASAARPRRVCWVPAGLGLVTTRQAGPHAGGGVDVAAGAAQGALASVIGVSWATAPRANSSSKTSTDQ